MRMSILTLDVGGTAIKSALFSESGTILEQGESDSCASQGAPVLLDTVFRIIDTYFMSANGSPQAIGISTAGQVDAQTGTILYANDNIPGYTGVELKSLLSRRFGIPVAVENDVNAAALGEAHFGAGREARDFLCLTYGTGIGGAIIINRKLYAGELMVAGEMGHIITHAGGLRCACSGHGCYEQYASVSALCRSAAAYHPRFHSGRAIFDALPSDSGLKRVVDQWIEEILLGLVSITHIFAPSLLVLGGGVMTQPYLIKRIQDRLTQEVMPRYRGVRIAPAMLRNTAGLYGAYSLAKALLPSMPPDD